MDLIYRAVEPDELCVELFAHFDRYQKVTHCWRRENGEWVIKPVAFVEQWGPEKYDDLVKGLRHTLATGGVVFGVFADGQLKGFSEVEPEPLGPDKEYLELSSLHVSYDFRRHGAGKKLLSLAADWARDKGAKKLYISAHSSVESQAFYRSVGCVDAVYPDAAHVEKEPCDCQLEYRL